MSRTLTPGRLLLTLLPLLAVSGLARAQANRVFVAAKNGSDSNACDVAAPCQTFGGPTGALSKVAAGGEIIVLESGGYGKMTITQSVRINAPAGIVAFIHPNGGDAITISASASDTVILRGLTLNSGSGNGITVSIVGRLFVERCTITGFAGDGIHFQMPGGRLFMRDDDVRDSGNGVEVLAGTAVIRDSTFADNVNAGVSASSGISSVAVTRSTAAGNAIGFLATDASMMLDGVQAVSNTDKGLSATGTGTLRFVNSVVSQNATGVGNAGAGVLMGSMPGTSVIAGNPSSDGIPNGTAMTLR